MTPRPYANGPAVPGHSFSFISPAGLPKSHQPLGSQRSARPRSFYELARRWVSRPLGVVRDEDRLSSRYTHLL